MELIRLLLFPFSLLYGLVVILRNWAYDAGVIKSTKFNLPVISVGNMAVGGAGKSPMTEYLVRLLKNRYKVAILSRGYGRKTSGFLLVEPGASSTETGDEALQFKQKFNDITVAVCEDRVEGISRLEKDHELIILDDAYQHRAVKPGLSILLFDYSGIFKTQWLLPTGDLREPLSEKKRADIIVVTKTPKDLNEVESKRILAEVKARRKQHVFFSYLNYSNLRPISNSGSDRPLDTLNRASRVILLTGIANADPMLSEIERYTPHILHHNYPDHHNFSKKNISKLVLSFEELEADDKLIITTEKDAQRLKSDTIKELLRGFPVYYLPIEADIHEPEKTIFNKLVEIYAAEPTINN